MASDENTTADIATSSSATVVPTFNLQVVSPSVGVTSPLRFSDLPITTTVEQLKEKVRNLVDTRPEDEAQRLIHRGRLLSRPDQTMQDIFGEDTLRTLDSQTLHLVLKPSTSSTGPTQHPSFPQTTQDNPSRSTPNMNGAVPQAMHNGVPMFPPAVGVPVAIVHQQQFHIPNGQQFHISNGPQYRVLNGQPVQATTQQNPGIQQPGAPTVQRLQELQQEGQRLHQELLAQQQIWRERMATAVPGQPLSTVNINQPVAAPQSIIPSPVHGMAGFQNIVGQMQRDRAAMGINGVQNNAQPQPHQNNTLSQPPTHMPIHVDGTTSPWVRTSRREGVGPHGERWHITVNETVTNIVNTGQLQVPDYAPPGYAVQQGAQVFNAIARGDQQQARQRFQEAAQSHPPQNPGGSIVNPAETSIDVPTAPVSSRTSHSGSQPLTPQITSADPASQTTDVSPMVYLVSSPAGPRALLISGTDQFFTPQQPSQFMQQQAVNLQALRVRQQARAERHAARRAAATNGPPNAANPPAADAPANAVNADANNNMMVQMLPHVWLLIRLAGFVWFLVSGDSSWYRWTAVISLAVVVFLVNTGLFNDAAEQVWGPIRRHLENLLPLAAPERPAAPANGAVAPNADVPAGRPPTTDNQIAGAHAPSTTGRGPARPRYGELDPAQVAARLIDQRRQRQDTWLWTRLRRAEHATILFLASLIPGVGERHILARAAEDNLAAEAERQRREAAETAESATAATTSGTDVVTSTPAIAAASASSSSIWTDGDGTVATNRNGNSSPALTGHRGQGAGEASSSSTGTTTGQAETGTEAEASSTAVS